MNKKPQKQTHKNFKIYLQPFQVLELSDIDYKRYMLNMFFKILREWEYEKE